MKKFCTVFFLCFLSCFVIGVCSSLAEDYVSKTFPDDETIFKHLRPADTAGTTYTPIGKHQTSDGTYLYFFWRNVSKVQHSKIDTLRVIRLDNDKWICSDVGGYKLLQK